MWAIATADLHLSEHRFWAMTPLQFHVLHKRYVQAEKRADYRSGVVAAILANVNRDPKKSKPYKPEDFFPSLKGG